MPHSLGFNAERAADFYKLRKKILDIHGAKAELWLDTLPVLLQQYQDKWQIRILEPVQGLSYNLVFHAQTIADAKPVILKVGLPHADLWNEITALEYFAGHGCVQLINSDHADGIMLIEQAVPGTMLSELSMHNRDETTVVVCAEIIKMLHLKPAVITPELRRLPKLSDRLAEYAEVRTAILADKTTYAAFDLDLLQQAEDMFGQLCQTTRETVVLHGDLHHYNILSATRAPWLAIDPKGVIGDPIFELAAFMCNPYPQVAKFANLKELLIRRIELFHALLGYDMRRTRDWAAVHAILAAGQNLTSHGEDWQEMLMLGKMLLELDLHGD